MDQDDDVTLNRIVLELGYDPNDVCDVRVSDAAIEVDFIDFASNGWPLITRRHAAPTTPPVATR